jgi:hypothetical protein
MCLAPHPTENGCNEHSPTKTVLLDLSITLELVELYFDLVHDQFHTLFHRPSFIEAVLKDEAPPTIYAMLALSAGLFNSGLLVNSS